MPSPLLLGVDGGGTKTLAWLAPLDDAANTMVLGRGQAGPGNPRAAGFETAQANIAAAIEAAFADAGLPPAPVTAACFGLAGAGRPAEQVQIAAWAVSRGIAAAVRVVGDAEPILAAATPDNVGVALICGTGSLALGRNAEGKSARCGGWGYLLGDEGSGYAIALAGLRAAMRSADGRGPATALLKTLQAELNAADTADIVGSIYGTEMTRERIAALARVVLALADQDRVAQAILAGAAAELAEQVRTVARELGFTPGGYSLALAGGVLVGSAAYRDLVVEALRDFAPSRVTMVEHPVRGAVALARLGAQSG